MSSSQPAEPSASSPNRRINRQDRQDDSDPQPVRVAPYLTHVVTHHGQLTLIPPQNAGRIRKPTKKKKHPAGRDRLLDDDEPRFTTAVPLSSSRKLHPAPAHVRTRKHAISTPSPASPAASPATSRRYDPIVDDQSIPDYPPPSFEDAIASPHVPPHLSSSATDPGCSLSQSHGSIDSPPQSDYPLTSSLPTPSVPPSAAPSSTYDSPAASQRSLPRSVDLHTSFDHPHPRSSPFTTPSPLASQSTTTLLSSVTAVSEPAAFSDTPLLQRPQRRSVPQSSIDQPAPQPRECSPTRAPYRLTSPSTTTLLSPTHAVRDSPSLSELSLLRPQRLPPDPASPEIDLSVSAPSSPYPDSRTSLATASDVFEEFTWEPRQRWSADRRLGFTLEERVEREFQRRLAAEGVHTAERIPPLQYTEQLVEEEEEEEGEELSSPLEDDHAGAPVDPYTHRCFHCGSVRPLGSGDIQSIHEGSDEEGDVDDDSLHPAAMRSLLPRMENGKSPYLQQGPSQSRATLMSRSQFKMKSQSPEPTSPSSPSAFFKMSSAWASSVTLLTTALTKDSQVTDKGPSASLQHAKPLKRKESFGVKRLFSGLKGKEREHSRSQSVPSAALSSNVDLNSSFASSSDSSSTSESIDAWEVVSVEAESAHSAHSAYSTRSPANSTAPTSPARSVPEGPSAGSSRASPSSPTSDGNRPAFINRPVRVRALLDSPTTPTSPSLPFLNPVPLVTSPATTTSPASARPFLPEKSPLRMLRNAQQQLGEARVQTHSPPVNASPAHTHSPQTPAAPMGMMQSTKTTVCSGVSPRAVRPSPSVVWKAPSPVSRSPLSQTPTSGSPVRQSPLTLPSSPSPSHLAPNPASTSITPMHPVAHPAITALSRSEKNALRHQSAPLPTMAMALAMSRELAQSQNHSPNQNPSPSPSPSTPVAFPAHSPVLSGCQSHPYFQPQPQSQSQPQSVAPSPVDGYALLRRRRAITPPPSHRKATLHCETGADLFGLGGPLAVAALASASATPAIGDHQEEEALRPEPELENAVESERTRRGRMSPVPASPVSPVSTPTTPTRLVPDMNVSGPSQPHHYRGRPLPQVPVDREHGQEHEESVPVKRVPDGYSVNRVPEGRNTPPPPLPSLVPTPITVSPAVSSSPSPAVSASHIPPPPPPAPPTAPTAGVIVAPSPSPAAPSLRPSSSSLTVPALREPLERSVSGGSVLEDIIAGEEDGPRPEFLQITDLDILAERALAAVEDGNGRAYDDLLLVSEVLGPAAPPSREPERPERSERLPVLVPFTGSVEVQRRRVLKDGRVKLKLSLLGVPVDRCGVCLSQFRRDERAALTPACKHSFHEVCLRRWLRTSRACPMCRIALSMDD